MKIMKHFTCLKLGLFVLFFVILDTANGQVVIAKHSFEESGDTWNVTIAPAAYNTEDPIGDNGPVDGDEDVWDNISAFTGDIPGSSDGVLFWGMQDLNNGNGGGNFDHTIETDWVDVSAYNSVEITFDYYTKGFDGGDDLSYQVAYDMGAFGAVVDLNDNTLAWTPISINAPNGTTSVKLRLIASQNGGSDYGGWDNLEVSGTPASQTFVQFVSESYSLDEDGITVEVCASIINPDVNASTVEVALNGASTATNGTDYDDGAGTPMAISFPITLTFPASSSANQCFDIFISNDDSDVEGNETIELELQNASGGNMATIGTPATSTVTIIDNDFAAISCPAGTEEQSQGFEGGGSWGYTVSGNSQALPCSSGDDYVGEGGFVGTGGNIINANGGSQFFAVRDIQGDCAGPSGVDLVFSTFSASALTEGNYAVSFDYNAYQWDNGDDISYEISVNSSIVASGDAVSGISNFSTGGWQTETINVTLLDGDGLDFTITLDQNGDGDWGGIDNVVLCFISILPVDLTLFEAVPKNGSSLLSWQTATEQNNSHFLIQHSTDGRVFENIGRVEGKGDSDRQLDYEFVDTKPAQGLNYYRLQQFDFDGSNAFYGPVAVRFGEDEIKEPRIWPVPTSGLLQIELPDSDDAWELTIYDLTGQLLQSEKLESKSINTIFDLGSLPAGTYLLQWQNGQQNGQQRVVKL